MPPISRASRRTAWLAAGIQGGFGTPWPCREDNLMRPERLRLGKTVSEMSSVCITSAMMVRCDQSHSPTYIGGGVRVVAGSQADVEDLFERVPSRLAVLELD